jgi:hypothetical protein
MFIFDEFSVQSTFPLPFALIKLWMQHYSELFVQKIFITQNIDSSTLLLSYTEYIIVIVTT